MFNSEAPLNDSEFNKFRKLIYDIAGISLSERKRELVKSRLARRLRYHNLGSYSDYYDLLCDPQRAAQEIEHFTNALTTNKTEFFREAHHFDYLRNDFFPLLRQATLSGREKKVRIWCAAASTGQEPYTLSMTMLDYFGPHSDWDLRLLASDIDTQVLETAIAGVYPESDMDGMSESSRKKHFQRESRGTDPTWRAKPEIKQLITFRQLNLIHPNWPINTQFDAIFCRNVMIYFDQPTQTRLVDRFSEYLLPGGLLVIGHSESLFSITDQFDSLGDTIYRLKASASSHSRRPSPVSVVNTRPTVVSSTPKASASGAASRIPKAIPSTSNRASVQREADASAVNTRSITQPAKQPITRLTNSTSTQQHMARMPGTNADDPDPSLLMPTKVLVAGEYEASREECMLQTVLGSCVAACLYDPTNRIGGMNHFMLPEALDSDRVCATYGVHAMELLINAIMRLGGNRQKLIAKVFGGARVVDKLSDAYDVGRRNVEFVKRFLDTERIPIVAEHVLGNLGRRVKLIPTTGKVFVSVLNRMQSIGADNEEREDGKRAWVKSLTSAGSMVTMFNYAGESMRTEVSPIVPAMTGVALAKDS